MTIDEMGMNDIPSEFMNDPLYRKVLTAKSAAAQKKAMETLKAIRGPGALNALKFAMNPKSNRKKNVDESTDKIKQVADLIKSSGKDLMSMRTPLESIFKKKDVDFVLSPMAHFRIKEGGKTLIIVNKKYADDAEEIVGQYAIGYEGKI